MDLYYAGERAMWTRNGEQARNWGEMNNVWLRDVVEHRLFSFYYNGWKQKGDKFKVSNEICGTASNGVRMFLDSGAYTAYTKKQEITVERYLSYLDQHGAMFNIVANLDVIDDTGAKSWENWRALSDGYKRPIMPVFHHNDDTKWLVKMLEKADYIALGGMVGASTLQLRMWLDDIWRRYLMNKKGEPRVKVHGFGITDITIMERYPWHSVDSSSWVLTSNFGNCLLEINKRYYYINFSPVNVIRYKINGWHYDALTAKEKKLVDKELASFGLTADQCKAHHTFRDYINISMFKRLAYNASQKEPFDIYQKGLMNGKGAEV